MGTLRRFQGCSIGSTTIVAVVVGAVAVAVVAAAPGEKLDKLAGMAPV